MPDAKSPSLQDALKAHRDVAETKPDASEADVLAEIEKVLFSKTFTAAITDLTFLAGLLPAGTPIKQITGSLLDAYRNDVQMLAMAKAGQ